MTPAAPTAADVARIAALRDRVIRNLEITQCYAELARAMAVRTGHAADWCAFATWASRQAGGTIRGEDLLTRLERHLRRSDGLLAPVRAVKRALLRRGVFAPETVLGRLVAAVHTPFDAFERASDAVARGNLRVFEEIAREFARFLAMVPADAAPDSAEFAAFAAWLRPGPPPDGQDLLREAFGHYQQQRLESDPSARAGWLLLANLKIGLHEQTRLQPLIAEAVDAPVVTARDLGGRLLGVVAPRVLGWPAAFGRPIVLVVGVLARPVWTMAAQLTRAAVTERMMVLTLPGAVLSLGETVAAPVPAAFTRLSLPAFDAFARAHDPCGAVPGECGARDWTELPQRMHYILHLFRAYAEERSLFDAPFASNQVTDFRAGRIPDGRL